MKVLAAVDLYADPELLVASLAPWAERIGATVDLTYASPFDTSDPSLRDAGEALRLEVRRWRDVQDQERATLQELTSQLSEPTRGTPRLLTGRALDVLPEASKGYDLAIVGTQGSNTPMRALIGSVAERVVRLAACSVLVLRLDRPARPLPTEPTVVAPLDLPTGSEEALATTRQLLGGAVALHVVHVIPRPPFRFLAHSATEHAEQEQLLARAAARHGHPRATTHVVSGAGGNVGADIVAVARQLHADLLALPTHGRQGIARLTLGSVAERVIRLAECPVLVTRSSGA